MTNFKDTIDIDYQGPIKSQFKEGDKLVLTAYLPNVKQKSRLVGIDHLTNHSMETENWQGSTFKSRNKSAVFD